MTGLMKEYYNQIVSQVTLPSTEPGFESLKNQFGFRMYCAVRSLNPDDFIKYMMEQSGLTLAQGAHKDSASTPDTPHSSTRYDSSNPLFGGRVLSYDDELALAQGLFERNFSDDFLGEASQVCRQNYNVNLNKGYAVKIALSGILNTKREEAQPKIDKLYGYICRAREKGDKNTALSEDDLYISAMQAIKDEDFDILKQFRLDDIYDKLKNEKMIPASFRDFLKSKKKINSYSDYSNPASFIYMAILENPDEKYISNAKEWYNKVTGKPLSKEYRIAPNTEEALSILNDKLPMHNRNQRESIDYLRYILKLKNIFSFISYAGLPFDPAKIKHKIDSNATTDIMNFMKREIGRYKEGENKLYLDVLEFLYRNKFPVSKTDAKDILEKLASPDHLGNKIKPKTRHKPTGRRLSPEKYEIDPIIIGLYREITGNDIREIIAKPTNNYKAPPQAVKENTLRYIEPEPIEIPPPVEADPPKYKRFKQHPGDIVTFEVKQIMQKKNKTVIKGIISDKSYGGTLVIAEVPNKELEYITVNGKIPGKLKADVARPSGNHLIVSHTRTVQ